MPKANNRCGKKDGGMWRHKSHRCNEHEPTTPFGAKQLGGQLKPKNLDHGKSLNGIFFYFFPFPSQVLDLFLDQARGRPRPGHPGRHQPAHPLDAARKQPKVAPAGLIHKGTKKQRSFLPAEHRSSNGESCCCCCCCGD